MSLRKIIYKTKNLVFDLNDNYSLIGTPLVLGWNILHKLKFVIGKKILELKGQLRYGIEIIDYNKFYHVNPQKIQYYLEGGTKKWENSSAILKGNWDKSKKIFNDSPLYMAFKQMFNDGKKWDEIKYFQKIIEDISNGKIRYTFKTKNEWSKNLNTIEEIYKKNKEEKFISEELYEKLDLPSIFHDIIVNIDRDGQLLLTDGEFGLSLAKLFDIPEVPIKIKIRHKKWWNFKKNLSYFSRRGTLYQKVTHPDLQDYPYQWGDLRYNLIKDNLSVPKGTLLDIGTNLGYFCHRMEEEGFDCYGVEENWLYRYFLKKLKKAENRQFKIISKSIFRYNENKELVFDVVLALFIFHHFLKRKNTYLNLIKLLNRLKVKEMFFGAHNPREFQNKRGYVNYNPDQFVNFLIENSCLKKAKLIGKMKNGRCIYKLTS